MKLKKKVYGMLAAVLLLTNVFTEVQWLVPVHAETVKVSINGTELQDDTYYEFEGFKGSGTMQECDPAALPTVYIYYNAGVMEVHNNVRIYSNGGSSTEVLKIENGTLTLTGDGRLCLQNDWDTETLIAGNAVAGSETDAGLETDKAAGTGYAALRTDDYTGNIVLNGYGGDSLIKGLSLVDLQTTGDIAFNSNSITGDAFISAGSVRLEASNLELFLLDGTVKHMIESTDAQNGEIRLIKTDTLNYLSLINGNSINASEAFFKAKDVFVSSNGTTSNRSIWFIGEAIAEGNLKIEAKSGVELNAQSTAVNGNLNISVTDAYSVNVTSEKGAVSTGDTEINAPVTSVRLETNGNVAVIEGNAKINAERISMKSTGNAVIAGNAELQAQYGIDLVGAEGYPVIKGDTIILNTSGNEISIIRSGSAASDTPPILGGALQTRNDVVIYEDGGTRWVQILATGQIYYADNCEHPIILGYLGRCMVCETSEIEYAELIGADGTSKRMLTGDLGGSGTYNDLKYLEDGDTIKLIRDLYANGRDVTFDDAKAVTLDLNGHTLMLGTLSAGNDLTIANGSYKGKIANSGVALTKVLAFRNAKATLGNLQWMTDRGVELEESEVTVAGNNSSEQCWLEKLTMDKDSKLVLNNVGGGIGNYGHNTLEESLGSIQEFLPEGYSLVRRKVDPADADDRNTINDPNGEIAQSVVIRYRRMTDADVAVTLNPTTYTYDKTAKEPEVLVTYDGQTLVKDKDYTAAYADNVNAGSAVVTITGMGIYHDVAQVHFTIEKAAQAAPAGLTAVNVSKSGAKDGAIEKLTMAMEYSTDEVNWISVTAGTTVSGLAAGNYYVRYAETENYQASPSTKVEITAPADNNSLTDAETVVTLGATKYAYNGKVKKPSVKSVTLAGKQLKAGIDYTVTYKKNKNIGKASVVITGKGDYTGSVTKTFTIYAKKGTTVTSGAYKYKFTGASQVAFAGIKSTKTTKVVIPKSVKLGGKTFKVTSIAKKALYNKSKVKSVTIGENVKTIGASAFQNCKKLSTITVKTTKLKSAGKNALKGIKANAKIKVPSKKLKAYKKLLKSKGQGTKVKIVKK